jgi:hypothetical protein
VHDPDGVIDRVAEVLKEPVRIDPAFDGRVMAELARLPARRRSTPIVALTGWLVRKRTIAVSPLGGLAAAAGIALAVLAGRAWLVPGTGTEPAVGSAPALPSGAAVSSVIQFVVVAPRASSVSLVGDFNDWDAAVNPMHPAAGNGLWSVTVPLAPGRYRYSFLVDGTRWLPDPEAPRALEDDFGRPNSVVTVGGT